MSPPAKKIFTDFSLLEISAVDNPAQEGARVLIMKRADSIAENILKYIDPADGAMSFQEVFEDTERRDEYWNAVEEVWPILDALNDSVRSVIADMDLTIDAKRSMLSASVDDFLSAVVEKIPDAEQVLRKFLFDPHDAAKGKKPDPDEDEDPDMPEKLEDLKKDLAAAVDRADKAEAALKAFEQAAIEKNEETVTVNGQEIKKSAVGDVAFAALKAQSDDLAKAKAEARSAEYTKRAEDDFANLPGEPVAKGKCLQAIDKMIEADRVALSAMLAAGNAAIGKAMKAIGKSGDGTGGTDEGHTTKAEKKVEALAAEIVKRDGGDHISAVAKAWEDNPELYNEYLAEKEAAA